MKSADVTWYVKEPDGVYVTHSEYYAGSCNATEDFLIDIEIWNNRWNNSEDVSDMTNSKLAISFANAEDSVLLSLCDVSIGEGPFEKPDLSEFNRGLVYLGTIYGTRNSGHINSTRNYKRVSLRFKDLPNNFREGIKSMYLDVQFDE